MFSDCAQRIIFCVGILNFIVCKRMCVRLDITVTVSWDTDGAHRNSDILFVCVQVCVCVSCHYMFFRNYCICEFSVGDYDG